jgi:hypothetical protein
MLNDSFCAKIFEIATGRKASTESISRKEFETHGGADVFFVTGDASVSVEAKPFVGDDYPAVMRQMKRSCPLSKSPGDNRWVAILLIRDFHSEAIGEAQLREFFGTSRIMVVFEREVDAALAVNVQEPPRA